MKKVLGFALVLFFIFSLLPANAQSAFEKAIESIATAGSYLMNNDYKVFETRDEEGTIFFNKNKISCLFIRETDHSQASQCFRVFLVVDGKEFLGKKYFQTLKEAEIWLKKLMIYFELCLPE